MLKLKAAKGQEEVVQFYNKHQWWTQIQTFHHFMSKRSKLMMTLTIPTFPPRFCPHAAGGWWQKSQPFLRTGSLSGENLQVFPWMA